MIEFKNVGNEILFLSHLKKVLNKATYCVHCEVCEVECPTGALSVVPMVTVNENKCIHCFKCLDFDANGCVIANSIQISKGSKMNIKKASIDRYNNFGFRENWLSKYFEKTDAFFNDDSHGLNVQKQIPSLVNWLRDAEVLKQNDKTITELGKLLSQKYSESQNKIWEIIWINLTEKSEISRWFSSNIDFRRIYSKTEMEILLKSCYEGSPTTLSNGLNALRNTFKESPLGKTVSVGVLTQVDKKPALIRQPCNDISPVAAAYSLYRYAESKKRYALTVSELYDAQQTEGIYRQFGVSRGEFESILRVLTLENNRVLEANLNMGLDNINLREDLTSMDILKLLL